MIATTQKFKSYYMNKVNLKQSSTSKLSSIYTMLLLFRVLWKLESPSRNAEYMISHAYSNKQIPAHVSTRDTLISITQQVFFKI